MKPNPDGTLTLPAATLSTADVDALIRELAVTRSLMWPPVPEHISEPDSDMTVQTVARYFVIDLANDFVAVGFRHPGLGWLMFGLGAEDAAQLALALMSPGDEAPTTFTKQ